MNYETVIGLEVHAQLQTRSKMYCRCSADYADAPPNTHVCPVCLGLPGVLPVINRRAVEFTMMTALALSCSVSEHTKFDRKNYSYPDLMKGYQISQYDAPVGVGGWLDIEVDGQPKKVRIRRVHLEEDVARLVHCISETGEACSLVDVNRSGAPLMEVVSEPDMHTPEEARQYLMALRSILQYTGVSTANMEEGSFRCDANISIRPEGSPETLAKVEIKNMNSFRAVFRALEYEEVRQRKVADEGGVLVQETRGWVDERGVTVSQRSKEYAHDYRYFPEPDLPPLAVDREWVGKVKTELPELPRERRDRFIAGYGLSRYDADLITASRTMADYFEESLRVAECRKLPEDRRPKEVCNWLVGEVSRILNAGNIDIPEFRKKVKPEDLVRLLVMSAEGIINAATAKTVLEEMSQTGQDPASIVARAGLGQIGDTAEVEKLIARIVEENPQAVADYKNGKTQATAFLVGQVMKATKGRANPKVVNELLKKKLEGV